MSDLYRRSRVLAAACTYTDLLFMIPLPQSSTLV